MSARTAGLAVMLGGVVLPAANAQDVAASSGTDAATTVDEIVVSGSRLSLNLKTVPGSVTIIDDTELKKQLSVTSDLGAVLATQVPGFGTSGGNAGITNLGQTLRGRKVLVLIDGVQVSTPLRDGARDMRAIDGSMIESVEVLRGSSALYGNGGGGGIINYITKGPGAGPLTVSMEAGTEFSLTHFENSQRPSVRVGARGSSDSGWDYNFSGRYEQADQFYDANGRRIAGYDDGGLMNSDERSGFGKVGYSWGEQRLQATVLWYKQVLDAAAVTIPGDYRNGVPARAAEVDPALGPDPYSKNLLTSLVYTNKDVLGSTVRAEVLYQKFDNLFRYNATLYPAVPGGTARLGGNSFIEGEKRGFRLDVTSPLDVLLEGASILWGMDVINDLTEQSVVPGRKWVPEMDMTTLAPFLQFELPVTSRLSVSGGVRYDKIEVDVDSYVTLFTALNVQGGKLDYSKTTFNIGPTLQLTDGLTVYASFSQGFSLADLGVILRNTTQAGLVSDIQPDAQLQDKWEIGLRTEGSYVRTSLAAFFNESELGVSFVANPANPLQTTVLRDPERIWGVEGTIDVDFDAWRFGGTGSWVEGKRDGNRDGSYETYLNGVRIPPYKLTAYIERAFGDVGSLRLQGLYSGTRDRFPASTAIYEGNLSSYFTLDALGSMRLGPGVLSVGLNNALNRDYYPTFAQMNNRNENYIPAEGRTAKVGYVVEF